MRFAWIFFIFICLFSCEKKAAIIPEGSVDVKDEKGFFSDMTYAEFKQFVSVEKATTPADSLHLLFTDIYTNYIPFYWIGTPWNFNGTSRVPQHDSIACGYFVTNTLKDIGFPVRRIYHAQQASSVMIRDITNGIKRFSSFEELRGFIERHDPNHVFIVGLDFHTGFIIKDKNGSFFLHSYYVNDQGVVKEDIDFSSALRNSNTYMLGCLTTNSSLMNHWKLRE